MTKVEVLLRLQDIFRDIFDDDELEIMESTSSANIEEWDSLNHINLVVAIEKSFGIKFSFIELASLKDVGAMTELIITKI